MLKTLVKQRNAISMGLAKQKFSIQTSRNLEHTRKLVLLLKTLAKQRNAISMGLAKQESCTLEYSV